MNRRRLWKSNVLMERDHLECWYRSMVYSALFDHAFAFDHGFKMKRSECITNTSKLYERGNKVDMLWVASHLQTEQDLFVVEDKKESCTKALLQNDKNKNVSERLYCLKAYMDNLNYDVMDDLEALTAEWHGLNLKINGSRIIGNFIVHYEVASASVPRDMTVMYQAAHLLLVVLSVKRAILLNYTKLNIILEEQHIHMLNTLTPVATKNGFYRDDSAEPDELNDSQSSNFSEGKNQIQENDLYIAIKEKLDDAWYPSDVLTKNEWEELLSLQKD